MYKMPPGGVFQMRTLILSILTGLVLAGCGVAGWSPEQLEALKGDGACVAFIGNANVQLYGNIGAGAVRLNSPGKVSVSKDGTITCSIE